MNIKVVQNQLDELGHILKERGHWRILLEVELYLENFWFACVFDMILILGAIKH